MNQPVANSSSDAPTLAVWEYAGLMLTYWCNARCAFCYVYSGPDRGGRMSREQAVALWQSLDELTARDGRTQRIHLAGGEPFGDWPHLASIVRAARDAGLSPLEKVETNAFWATDVNVARARLELLDRLGMERLIVSADVYHQEFVPFERVQNLVTAARQVLGKGRLIVRWWDFFNKPVDIRKASAADKARAYAAAIARHQDRLTGRAALRLAHHFELKPAEAFEGDHCVKAVLRSKHVHIDHHGHIFPGTCGGIILGTASGNRTVADVWDELSETWADHPVVGPVVAGGSYELLQKVKPLGYVERPEGYANKCHLCMDIRQFLVDRGLWPESVGPPECYANARDKTETLTAEAQRTQRNSQ